MMSCSISPTDFTITTAVVAKTNTTILTIIEEHFNTLIAMKYNGNYQTHRKLGQRCTGQVWCPSNFKQVWAITPSNFCSMFPRHSPFSRPNLPWRQGYPPFPVFHPYVSWPSATWRLCSTNLMCLMAQDHKYYWIGLSQDQSYVGQILCWTLGRLNISWPVRVLGRTDNNPDA